MISLIVCSRKPSITPELEVNLRQTVGTDYEVVVIDNKDNRYSICSAYNEGVRRAKGDILCFMHEDIVFHTTEWGKKVEQHFKSRDIGAIGVAGGYYVPDGLDWRFIHVNKAGLLQGRETLEESPLYFIMPREKAKNSSDGVTKVVILDGVWLCIKKEMFDEIQWDEETFNDFHLYDSDICMQINALGKPLYVCHDILLEHKSEGVYTRGFLDSQNIFLNKWRSMLPYQEGMDLDEKETEEKLRKAQDFCKERLEFDRIKLSILQKYKQHRENELTTEEIAVREMFTFRSIKLLIKCNSYSGRYVWNVAKTHGKNLSQKNRRKLYTKFFWYRIIPTFRKK